MSNGSSQGPTPNTYDVDFPPLGTPTHNMTNMPRQSLEGIVRSLPTMANSNATPLPYELAQDIFYYTQPDRKARKAPSNSQPANLGPSPSTPPRDGRCVFMELPTELRRNIFVKSLPARDAVHHPHCEDDPSSRPRASSSTKKKGAKKHSPALNLMLVNKKICAEIAEVLYQERWFVIHVHEGLVKGGIEFLRAGRQPLQFQISTEDERFWKFTKGSQFGFDRLKKVRVQIYPATEENCRHTAINTYFMTRALCSLLERGGEKTDSIARLNIEFATPKVSQDQRGRGAIQRAEQYWWDPDTQQPRATSIHNLPNIELVLRPFENLTGCQEVNIELPANLKDHPRISTFAASLKASMESKERVMFAEDALEYNIASAREAMEEYVKYILPGRVREEESKLSENEVREGEPMEVDSFSDDGDGAGPTRGQKHNLSPNAKQRRDWWDFAESQGALGDKAAGSGDEQMAIDLSDGEAADRDLQLAIANSLEHERPGLSTPTRPGSISSFSVSNEGGRTLRSHSSGYASFNTRGNEMDASSPVRQTAATRRRSPAYRGAIRNPSERTTAPASYPTSNLATTSTRSLDSVMQEQFSSRSSNFEEPTTQSSFAVGPTLQANGRNPFRTNGQANGNQVQLSNGNNNDVHRARGGVRRRGVARGAPASIMDRERIANNGVIDLTGDDSDDNSNGGPVTFTGP